MTENQRLIEGMAKIAKSAGHAILEIYQREDFEVQSKTDDSPLTAADLAAHNLIVAGLNQLAPEIPVLSEESEQLDFEQRRQWRRYFLVDPLDGTKEFINRNGEFTVNIALIEAHQPQLGVVYVPVQDVMFSGDVQAKSAIRTDSMGSQVIQTRSVATPAMTVVASRRHGSEALVSVMEALSEDFEVTTENVGSSLKFCLIAEGKADFYPRFAPTSEWDTGAAQAVVVAAGGQVVDLAFQPLKYNAEENILNSHFIVFADEQIDWSKYV